MSPKLGRALLLLVLVATPVVQWVVYRNFPQVEVPSQVTIVELVPEEVPVEGWQESADETAEAITDLAASGRMAEAVELANYALALPRHPDTNDPYNWGHATLALDRMLAAFEANELWDDAIRFCTRPNAVNIGNAYVESRRLRLLAAAFAAKRQLTFRSRILKKQLLEVREELDLREDIDKHHNEICSPQDVVDVYPEENEAAREHIANSVKLIDAYVLAMRGETDSALKAVEETDLCPLQYSRLLAASGKTQIAGSLLRQFRDDSPHRAAIQTALVEILSAAGDVGEVEGTLAALNTMLASFPADSPLRKRIQPIVASSSLQEEWHGIPVSMTEQAEVLTELQTEFPLRFDAPNFELTGVDGEKRSLRERRGQPTLVVFYLGKGCLHCSRQLKHLAPAASDFEDLGVSIVGISTDSEVALTKSFKAYNGRIPYPLLADVQKEAFKSYRLFQDGDEEAMHGTFLVDADGSILWRDTGEEPFMDMDFLLRESKRLLDSRNHHTPYVAAN
ncbi:MAG: peroxiredoxin family protein [Planctomycetaceae bacterium]